ncbi:MAG: phenylalanine 4-monooxygenase [Flavobacteriales bacterium]|nr:phenylalanine 4-monooxygenase [Flavobacteriales bacterium]MCB9205591.1 phenylalanine 4-monooxygenase [Flavobacteriales bacterium]
MIRPNRIRPTQQIYSNYTKEDFEVWKLLYNRQCDLLRKYASKEYLKALDIVGFSAEEIPDFNRIEEALKPLTGWRLETVPNISEQKQFFEFLSNKQFTATCWLRQMDELDYLEEPDMFHDIFGHVPLLSNKAYTDFFEAISHIALKYIENPKAIELLGRVYWFTIEFGLIRESGKLKIYGAGIISSYGETNNALTDATQKFDFDVKEILNTDFRTDILQDKYFVIDSYEQLYASIPAIESNLEKMI